MSSPPKPTPKPKALECPDCGGTIQLRGFGQTLNAVCIQCLSILDTQSPSLQVVQKFQASQRVAPKIPLGKRGKLHGDPWEVIGFQCRQIVVEGAAYEWREYLLFNPYKGFRYLTEYDGHWNDVKPITDVPEDTKKSGKRAVKYLGETYRHFQSARATTTFVMGEFPWQVRVGEAAVCEDFIAPPRMLSSERTAQEVTWSLGEYMTGEQVWRAFEVEGAPRAAKGVYANQPSPDAGKSSAWGAFLLLLILLVVVLLGASILMGQKEVFRRTYTFTPGAPGEASFVTPVFVLEGRPTNVDVRVSTNLDNRWAYFNLALINDETGQGYDFGREVSYYHGVDSDGSWTEGSSADSLLIPTVPAGRYYLRVEPEMEKLSSAFLPALQPMQYEIVVRRDVPFSLPFVIVPLLLVLPPLVQAMRRRSFETRRWAESDYAPSD
jgi:hypothetical protein